MDGGKIIFFLEFLRDLMSADSNPRKAFDDGDWCIFLSDMGHLAPALFEQAARGV